MKHAGPALLRITTVVVVSALFALPSSAGPEKVAPPAGYKAGVLYTTVDRPDNKQYRELYAPASALQAAKKGQPLPDGTQLVIAIFKARLDDKGEPLRDAGGRFIRGDSQALVVMEKRAGWGAEYPPDMRNGEWEYAVFKPDGTLNDKADVKPCFACHKALEKQDFVFSYDRMAAAAR